MKKRQTSCLMLVTASEWASRSVTGLVSPVPGETAIQAIPKTASRKIPSPLLILTSFPMVFLPFFGEFSYTILKGLPRPAIPSLRESGGPFLPGPPQTFFSHSPLASDLRASDRAISTCDFISSLRLALSPAFEVADHELVVVAGLYPALLHRQEPVSHHQVLHLVEQLDQVLASRRSAEGLMKRRVQPATRRSSPPADSRPEWRGASGCAGPGP